MDPGGSLSNSTLDKNRQSTEYTAMRDFRDLGALHAAHDLVVEIHDISQSFPTYDAFGVTRAIARSALAIPRSIAHGCGQDGDAGLSNALENAAGYTSELEYLVLLASELGLIDDETLEEFSVTLGVFKKQLEDDLADL